MTNQEKIWAWCDRMEKEKAKPYALQLYVFTSASNKKLWAATVQEFEASQAIWVSLAWITKGSTPEEAIAKLAEALGL